MEAYFARNGAPKIAIPRVITALLIAATLGSTTTAARADQWYSVAGADTFSIGTQTASRIVYAGSERLQISKSGRTTRYAADVRYTRTDLTGGNSAVRASFVQELLPGGTLEDREDDDPDFLTVLNQPFAIQLDAATLRDLRNLHGSVPFEAASPVTGGTLRGSLRRGPAGKVNGVPVVGVRFSASGTMRGPVPDRPEVAIDGTMRMTGIAYYAIDGALLLGLEARLTIDGKVHDAKQARPVRIVYDRTIRADDEAKTLRPTATPTDGGTASRGGASAE